MAKSKTIAEVIRDAVSAAGFKGEISGRIRINFDVEPLHLRGDDSRYRDSVERVPGVLSDEGQGDGYEFEIDAESYTLASQKRLLGVVERFRKSPAADGTEGKK